MEGVERVERKLEQLFKERDSPQLFAAIGWSVGRNDFVAELDRAADDDVGA
jgi:hypothetical protein